MFWCEHEAEKRKMRFGAGETIKGELLSIMEHLWSIFGE